MNAQHIRHAVGLGFIAVGFAYFYLIPSQPGISNMQGQWLAQTENAKAQEAALKATGQTTVPSGVASKQPAQVAQAPASPVQDCTVDVEGQKFCATRKDNAVPLTKGQILADAWARSGESGDEYVPSPMLGRAGNEFARRQFELHKKRQAPEQTPQVLAPVPTTKTLQEPVTVVPVAPQPVAAKPTPIQQPNAKPAPRAQGVNALHPRQDVKPGQKSGGVNDTYGAAQEKADESKLDAWAKKAQGH